MVFARFLCTLALSTAFLFSLTMGATIKARQDCGDPSGRDTSASFKCANVFSHSEGVDFKLSSTIETVDFFECFYKGVQDPTSVDYCAYNISDGSLFADRSGFCPQLVTAHTNWPRCWP
ncbi:hypothetical protein B0H34DRAFT_722098 [Crassisporium funariophilum]|nr:hypothetical protein B0H34DRAFT_722098 [Crassisporium funariophilum]